MSKQEFINPDGPVGLVDDQPAELESMKETFRRLGVDTVGTSQPGDLEDVLIAAEGGLAVDARLDGWDERSVEVARRYARMHPGKPIWFMSNFFGDGACDKMPSMVTPLAVVGRIEKAEEDLNELKRVISDELLRFARSMEQVDLGPALEPVSPEARSLLLTAPAVWQRMSPDSQDSVCEALAEKLDSRVGAIFQSSSAEWVVIAGPEGEVVRWGTDPELPSDQVLDEIQAREGHVPFLFARSLDVDDISVGGIPWPGTRRHRNYPSLKLRFLPGSGETHEVLFDTGSDANYLDQALAVNEGLNLGARPRTGYRLGGRVTFRELNAEVVLLDGRGSAGGQTAFRVVSNWDGTIGRDKDLQGLLTSTVLVDLKVAVRLCGRTCSLRLDDFDVD